jgi:hypothetical protein
METRRQGAPSWKHHPLVSLFSLSPGLVHSLVPHRRVWIVPFTDGGDNTSATLFCTETRET